MHGNNVEQIIVVDETLRPWLKDSAMLSVPLKNPRMSQMKGKQEEEKRVVEEADGGKEDNLSTKNSMNAISVP
ncbi:hypothetical protein A2U01_0033173, partial [Trifolium medium]|nr:hypothetical protein [Trifolium medium]